MSEQNNTVDSMLPIPKLFAYGLQHVLAMYAGAVAVPIIIAQAMHLPVEDLIRLITADLFTCGIATLIQTIGFGNIGGRIPMIQGVTFASVGPMAMIGAQHGMTAIYGAIIIAGIFTFLVAPFFSRLIRLFPPVVTGTIITIIGINLMPVAVNWMGGGVGNPQFGSLTNIGLGFLTFLIVIFTYKFAKGFLGNLSVLIGLIGGTAIAFAMGVANFAEVGKAHWVAMIEPFYFGMPTFDWASVLSMVVVMLVVMVETTGDSIAIGEIVDNYWSVCELLNRAHNKRLLEKSMKYEENSIRRFLNSKNSELLQVQAASYLQKRERFVDHEGNAILLYIDFKDAANVKNLSDEQETFLRTEFKKAKKDFDNGKYDYEDEE